MESNTTEGSVAPTQVTRENTSTAAALAEAKSSPSQLDNKKVLAVGSLHEARNAGILPDTTSIPGLITETKIVRGQDEFGIPTHTAITEAIVPNGTPVDQVAANVRGTVNTVVVEGDKTKYTVTEDLRQPRSEQNPFLTFAENVRNLFKAKR